MLILNLVFYVIALLIILSSLVVILAKNPMTSVLAMVFAFINTSILFVLLKAEFLAMVMLIIYVGAIAVLFIFIIMLLNIKQSERRKILTKTFIGGLIVAALVAIEIAMIIKGSVFTLPSLKNMSINDDTNNAYNLSLILYNNYSFIVILLGILLTIVVVGIVFINYQDDLVVKKQKMSSQVLRDPKTAVKIVKVDTEEGIK
ncbi:NADH-quinone oxidoreductase subunit J [Rickettsiales bacterium LUAb2]